MMNKGSVEKARPTDFLPERAVLRAIAPLLVAGIVIGSSGCLGDSTTEPDRVVVPVSIALAVPTGIPDPGGGSPGFRMVDGEDELVIEEGKLLIRDLRLRSASAESCQPGTPTCVEYLLQGTVIDLPIEDQIVPIEVRGLVLDRYDRVSFEMYTLPPNDPLAGDHPELSGSSIWLAGTFNDEPFTFTTDVAADLEVTLPVSLEVSEELDTGNVTVLADLQEWFRMQDGSLIDPRDAGNGEALEDEVENAIRTSWQAFRDNDGNGSPGGSGPIGGDRGGD